MFLLIPLMYAAFALTFIFGATSIHYAQPIFFIGLRMVITGIFILGYLILTKKQWVPAKRDWWIFGLLGIVHIFIPYVGENMAYTILPACHVSLMWNLSPLLTAVCSWVILRERMTWMKLLGLAIGLLGFVPLFLSACPCASSFLFISWADWLLIGAVVSAAVAWSAIRKLAHRYSILIINGWSMLLGGALSFVVSGFKESWHPFPVTNWPMTLWCVGALVILGGIIGYNLYGYLLKRYTATFLSFCGGLTPLLTALFARIFLGQPLSPVFLLSASITCVGLYLVYRQELTQGYITQ